MRRTNGRSLFPPFSITLRDHPRHIIGKEFTTDWDADPLSYLQEEGDFGLTATMDRDAQLDIF